MQDGVGYSGLDFRQFVERYALIGVWLVLIAVFSLLLPDTFFTGRNFRIIFGSQTILLVLTLGLVIALAVSEYDLSVGAVLSFAFQTTVILNVVVGLPIGWTVLIVVLAAVLFGARLPGLPGLREWDTTAFPTCYSAPNQPPEESCNKPTWPLRI
jgi:ABC-type xylose transport system permease subunit